MPYDGRSIWQAHGDEKDEKQKIQRKLVKN